MSEIAETSPIYANIFISSTTGRLCCLTAGWNRRSRHGHHNGNRRDKSATTNGLGPIRTWQEHAVMEDGGARISKISVRESSEIRWFADCVVRICNIPCPNVHHRFTDCYVNPLMGTGKFSVTSNNTKLVHWPLMGELLHLVQRAGDFAGPQPAQAPPRCIKCKVPTNHHIVVRCSAVLVCPLTG